MKIDKIIVGVDFSAEADVAIGQALDIARVFGAEVVLAHAGERPRAARGLSPRIDRLAESFEQILRDQQAADRAHLAELPARFDTRGLQVTHLAIDAPPARGLADAAHELAADLLVIGTHGRSGLRRFLLGSVAERAVRYARTTTLIARKPPRNGAYDKVLVPIDFSNLSDRVLDAAITLASPRAHLEVFHVWDVWDVPNLMARVDESSNDSWRNQMRAAATTLAHELIARHRDRSDIQFDFAQSEGAPAQAIHDRLDAREYDLVVVGSHGRRGVQRLVLGSVAETTARYAPCSTVVVHEPPKPPPPIL